VNQGLAHRLEQVKQRHAKLQTLLSSQEVLQDPDRLRELSREFSKLKPIVEHYLDYQSTCEEMETARKLTADPDTGLRQLAAEELVHTKAQAKALAEKLQQFLLPEDPDDKCNVFLEIRAGTGGEEAALFAGDLFRMYMRHAEQRKWKAEILSSRSGEYGGYKEIISRMEGKNIYADMKFESGTHRVQRIPETEGQGRIHTSACTVAVLPETENIETITVNKSDLRIDTYRASGAGGQHVNKTDSAVRITHLPTGIVVECQEERSQIQNRLRAMSLLQARLLNKARAEQRQEITDRRRILVGSGDRSERIRTYNFPQGRITDHRIQLTLHKIQEIMDGSLGELTTALRSQHQADQVADLENSSTS